MSVNAERGGEMRQFISWGILQLALRINTNLGDRTFPVYLGCLRFHGLNYR